MGMMGSCSDRASVLRFGQECKRGFQVEESISAEAWGRRSLAGSSLKPDVAAVLSGQGGAWEKVCIARAGVCILFQEYWETSGEL